MVDTPHQRAADIRLLVLDVDGVLTDGRLYFSPQGEEMKVFHVRDGAGIVQVLRAGIAVAVISGRDSRAVDRRMAELGVSWVRQGVNDKLAALREMLDILGLGPQAVACVGDDTPDLPLLASTYSRWPRRRVFRAVRCLKAPKVAGLSILARMST